MEGAEAAHRTARRGATSVGSKPRSRASSGWRNRNRNRGLRSAIECPSGPASPLAECPLSHAKGTLISLSSAAICCAGALARTLRGLRPRCVAGAASGVFLGPSCSLCSGWSPTGLWRPLVAAQYEDVCAGSPSPQVPSGGGAPRGR